MSLIKSTSTVKDIEKIWKAFQEHKREKDFYDLCIVCKKQLEIVKEIIAKKDFQGKLLELAENQMRFEGSDLQMRVKNLNSMLGILRFLLDGKKIGVEVTSSFVEKMFGFFIYFIRVQGVDIGKKLKVLANVLLVAISIVKSLYFKVETEDMLNLKLLEVFNDYLSNQLIYSEKFTIKHFPSDIELDKNNLDLSSLTLILVLKYIYTSSRKQNQVDVFLLITLIFRDFQSISSEVSLIDLKRHCQKFIQMNNIIKELSNKNRQTLNDFFQKFGEKFKQIFVAFITSYQSHFFTYNILPDLQLIFKSLVYLFHASYEEATKTVCNIPMIMFQLLFNTVIPSQSIIFEASYLRVLKSLSLKLIRELYCECKASKEVIVDFMIPQLLFSPHFFDCLQDDLAIDWQYIWTVVVSQSNQMKKICVQVLEELERNAKNLNYLQMFLFWIENLKTENQDLLLSIIKFGLFKVLNTKLREQLDLQVETQIITIIKSLMGQQFTKHFEIVAYIKDFFETFHFKSDEIMDVYEILIDSMLSLCNSKVFEVFLAYMKECKYAWQLKHALNGLERAMINKSSEFFSQQTFKEFLESDQNSVKLFRALVDLKPEKNASVDLWRSILSKVFIIADQPYLSFSCRPEFSLIPLIKTLREQSQLKSQIFIEVFEQMISTVFTINEGIIKFPHLIPLLCECLCENFRYIKTEKSNVIKTLKDHKINMEILATNKFFSVFFYYLMHTHDYTLFEHYQDICFYLISFHFTVYDLENWIDLLNSWPNDKAQNDLLRLLSHGIKYYNIEQRCEKFSYFAQSSYYKIDFTHKNLTFGKELNLLMWVYIENYDKCNVLALSVSKDKSIIITLTKNSVIVKMNEKSHEFSSKLYRNSWIFISINISSKRKATLSHSVKIQVFVDSKLAESSDKFCFSLSKLNKIDQASIGHNLFTRKDLSNFKGRISFLALNKKCIDRETVHEIYQQGPDVNWANVDKSFAKMGKDLKDYVLVDLLNVSNEVRHEVHGVYCVKFCSIIDTIKLYSVRNLILEIRKSIKAQDNLNEMLDIIRVIIEQDKEKQLIDKETIRFCARLIKKCGVVDSRNGAQGVIPDETCYLIQDIIKCLGDIELQTILFDSIIFNQGLFDNFTRKKSSFDFILNFFIKCHPFNLENLYLLLQISGHLELEEFSKSFIGYLAQVPELEVKQRLCPVIHKLDLEKKFKLLGKILKSLEKVNFNLAEPEEFSATILKIIDSYHPVEMQLLIIENLFFAGNIKENNKFEHLFDFLHNYLDTDISDDMIKYFLKKGFDNESPLKENRFFFIDIVIQRISHLRSNESKQMILGTLVKNIKVLDSAIFNRPIYPYWLDKYVAEKGIIKEIEEFFDFLFEYGQFSENFIHLERFFYISKESALLKYLIEKYSYDERINFLLPIHQVMRDQLTREAEIPLSICKSLKSSHEFSKMLFDSYETFNFSTFLSPISSSIKSPKPLIVNYLNFLLSTMDACSIHQIKFKHLKSFLRNRNIKYFETDDSESESSKVALAVFLSFQLLKRTVNTSYKLSPNFIEFSQATNLSHKLSQFMEKNFNLVEEALRDQICLKNKNMIDRESIELDYMENIKLVKENFEKFVKVLNSDEVEQEMKKSFNEFQDLFKIFDKVFEPFLQSQFVQPRFSQEYLFGMTEAYRNFFDRIKKKIEELEDIQWFVSHSDKVSRFLSKIEQDYKSYKKLQVKLRAVLENPAPKHIKVRQVYDKFYRWSCIKPFKSSDDFISELKLNQAYSGVPHVSENKEVFSLPYDQTSESPNTTNISETSATTSRDNTGVFTSSKHSNSQSFSGYFERIKVQGSYFGRFTISNDFIEFVFEGENKPSSQEFMGALQFTFSKTVKKRIWFSSEFSEVVLKRFIHEDTSLEFILKTGKSYFCNFFNKKNRQFVLNYVDTWPLKFKPKISQNDLEAITSEWKKGNMSNFEYLMILNKYASRSLNDLSQFPVFPWIISDYKSPTFTYDNKDFLRDLKFPVGAQSPTSQSLMRSKYNSLKEERMAPYHYGSHYSNCGIVVHFLLRLEPFTTQARELQGGNFDVADRLFISLKYAWESCSMGIGGDVKELIPDLFYNPFLFSNYSKFSFGVTSEGHNIVDVAHPPWAKSNWDFIIKNRNSLESLTVSKDLNNWIDLVFGYKQMDKFAENSFNVFTPSTYRKGYKNFCKDHEQIDILAFTEQVYHFGQTPKNLFDKKPHVVKEEGKNFDFFNFFYQNDDGDIDLKLVKNRISKPGNVNAMFLNSEVIIVIRTIGKVTLLSRFPLKETENSNSYTECNLAGFLAMREAEFVYSNKKFVFSKFFFIWNNNNFALFAGKLIVAGLDITNSLKLYDLKGKLVQSLNFHTMTILSVACTNDLIASAGLDSRIKIWKYEKDLFVEGITLNGHCSPVFCLRILDSYQLIVSASDQNLLLVHDIRSGLCLHKLDLKVKDIDVNEIGILAVATEVDVRFLGVNLDLIEKYEIFNVIKSIKLSPCGNFCIQCYEHSIFLHDIFDVNKEKSFSGCTGFEIIVSDKSILLIYDEKEEVHVDMLRFVSNQMILNQKKIIEELV